MKIDSTQFDFFNYYNKKNMKNSLNIILLVVGVILIGFGLYTVFSPNTIIEVGPIQVKENDNSFDTRSVIIIGLGILSIAGAILFKKK